jgi:hypothetical protein
MVQDQTLGMLMLAHGRRGHIKYLAQHLGVHWFGEMHIKLGGPCALLSVLFSRLNLQQAFSKINSKRTPPCPTSPPRFRESEGGMRKS